MRKPALGFTMPLIFPGERDDEWTNRIWEIDSEQEACQRHTAGSLLDIVDGIWATRPQDLTSAAQLGNSCHGCISQLSTGSQMYPGIRTGDKYFMLDQWNNFFVMVGGGAAALAGLIFVAISINPGIIIRNSTHKNRAINMLTGFTAVFMACSLGLIGNQSITALGFEWFALWLIATAIFIRGYAKAIRAGMSSIGLTVPRLAGGTICYLAEIIGAILLFLGRSAGLYVAAIATVVLFGFLISGAWLLIIGIHEDQAKR